MTENSVKRQFTGWHMTAILVSFFLVVITVNMVMARFAIATFGGTVVDNSYVASQEFNRWLDDAAAQRKAGWAATISLDQDRRVATLLTRPKGPEATLSLTAVATHVLGREAPVTLVLFPVGKDMWRSTKPLPKGRWEVRVEAVHTDSRARFQKVLG
ncbi:FixH family protein [Aquisediminimonas sediminicola]|uniref:FixH family protein n=1 Tax=Alteraquisediminimonas sediminicola TaxID=2676787 RepID=UPI001C8E6325|nr:FixH family protein [Aquisediminimonas sediminicola]